jgi:hypothetical protein
MRAFVINPYAKHYGEVIEVELIWTDSYISNDEVHYGKDELNFNLLQNIEPLKDYRDITWKDIEDCIVDMSSGKGAKHGKK